MSATLAQERLCVVCEGRLASRNTGVACYRHTPREVIVARKREVEAKGGRTKSVAERVFLTVALEYGFTPEQLKEYNRTKEISWARILAMYMVIEVAGLSFRQAEKVFERDHATIRPAHQKVRRLMNRSYAIQEEVEKLKDLCEKEGR